MSQVQMLLLVMGGFLVVIALTAFVGFRIADRIEKKQQLVRH